MTYTIGKTFTFAASHRLAGLPVDHQCSRLHGHNYSIALELAAATVNDACMVVDFGELGTFRRYLDDTLDHRHLNDVLPMNPTAENLAAHLHGIAVGLLGPVVTAVTVWETPTCWACYRAP